MKKLLAAAVVLGVMSFVAPMPAQAQTTVSGTATDANGNVLANVQMKLVMADGTEFTTTANSSGQWSFANVPAGAFTVYIVLDDDDVGGLFVPAGSAVTGLVVAAPGTGLSALAIAAIAAAVAAGVAGVVIAAKNDAS